MKIRELFVADVTRDIPPVIYFHEQSPAKLQAEVAEYIITGGFPDTDARARRVKAGIHEQFVRLLEGVTKEMNKAGGPELPAAWISGFYGSGKSSFAKLLGLSLNGDVLPDGSPLSAALLRCDDSPRRQELVDAWTALVARVKAFAVVFDIGGVARDGEHIHAAALRQVQVRLGYCPKSNLVADFELRLERDGEWEAFQAVARKTLGKEWSVASREEQAEDHFSFVLHKLKPERYVEPGTWIEERAGARTGAGTSASEVVAAIDAMIHLREPDKALFIVVDEVSQYVHQDEGRMLKLQSFVSELGQKLKGRVWLFATGQQQLEDQSETNNLGKLKDRFPSHLRVHLATANIRDVVHKRLLRKKPGQDGGLRDLFTKHRGDLKLYGYGCEEITEQDFLDVYPMLPGHIDLLMRITSNLRTKSSRVQGDSHAIRGLLQLLGELFREEKLADRDVGTLVTLDSIFEVQQSALDADVQTTLQRIFNEPSVRDDDLAQKAAKAVSLLELIQDQTPTTPELVAKCLYSRLGESNRVGEVTTALEKLRSLSLLSYSEKQGFKIQSSAGQEWQRERDAIGITGESVGATLQRTLKKLIGELQERPRWKARTFPWAVWFSDNRQAVDVKLQDARDDATVGVDFRFLTKKEERAAAIWTPKSDQEPLKDRILWVVGDGAIEDSARELARSERMVERFRSRRETLTREQSRLLTDEELRVEELDKHVQNAVREAFVNGTVFFRGQQLTPRDFGSSFGLALLGLANRILPDLYPHFVDIAITPTELNQLLEKDLSGPSSKFMDQGLGILSLDSGKYVASCSGTYPSRVLAEIQSGGGGMSGQSLIAKFVSPPYGYAPDLLKACCAGLLRGKKISIRLEKGDNVTSYNDPGVRELFTRDRDFRKADFFVADDDGIGPRDRVAIRKLLSNYIGVDVDSDDEIIADAVFQFFPPKRDQLRDVERRFEALPGRPELPSALQKLGRALEECNRSRLVKKTLLEVKRNLDVLRDGLEQLATMGSELTPEAVQRVRNAADTREHQVAQLREVGELGSLETEVGALESALNAERPWRETPDLEPVLARIHDGYTEARRTILNAQHLRLEESRNRLKLRAGFADLNADEAHQVLAAISAAAIDTTAEATSPTLLVLRTRFDGDIYPCEEDAQHLLDTILSRRTATQVLPHDPRLRGREIASRDELRALLAELEDGIGAKLDTGARVRIV